MSMWSAGATTHYNVVTNYYTNNMSQAQMAGYIAQTRAVGAAQTKAQASSLGMGRGLNMLNRMMLPLTGGLIGVATIGLSMAKVFSNLNMEMNDTIGIAAQLNLAFEFDANPVENFNIALVQSKSLFRDIVKDAAALPGELSDFTKMANTVSGSVFAAGGSQQDLRALTGKLAMAKGATNSDFGTVASGAMRMIQGVSTMRDPLFRMMMTTGLLNRPGSKISKVEDMNTLTLRERFERLDEGLSRLVDNPMFRKSVLNTFDTQLGTLADALFGVEGVLGKLGRDSFDGLLLGLTDLNEWITETSDNLVLKARILGINSAGIMGLSHGQRREYAGTGLAGVSTESGLWAGLARGRMHDEVQALAQERTNNQLAKMMFEQGVPRGQIERVLQPDMMLPKRWRQAEIGLMRTNVAELNSRIIRNRAEEEKVKGVPRDSLTEQKIEQNFHIKLDVNSDESPEAVAVKIRKAMSKVGKSPQITGRLPHTSPVPSP